MSTSWKGKTLNQIVSSVQMNKRTGGNTPDLWFRAQPIKHYRKEIALGTPQTYNARTSVKIDELNRPGGSIIHTKAGAGCNLSGEYGLANTLDISPTTIRAENYACPIPDFMRPDVNARRRVRSAGMIPRKFDENYNNDRYATSYNEYLVSRNRTIQQNGYVHLRKGNAGIEPGSVGSKSNVYSPNGANHCYQPMISEANGNNRFQYQWVNGAIYDVTIPDGLYSVDSLNTMFQTIMTNQGHYLIYNHQHVYLLGISYDLNTSTVVLNATIGINTTTYPWSTYQVPAGQSWTLPVAPNTAATSFIILDNAFQDIIGFVYGTYSGPGSNFSNFAPSILPNYVKLHYKPSNVGFATQGAVDSSLYTQREKFNVINTVAGQSSNIFGQATANAMAYNTNETAYTLKTKYGFRNTAVPVVRADGTVQACDKYRIRR
jgi:hypothetical protein